MTSLPRGWGCWQSADFEPSVLLAFSISGHSPVVESATGQRKCLHSRTVDGETWLQ